MNWFKDEPVLTQGDRQQFDVITCVSRSYSTKQHEILVPVGTADVDLPAKPMRLRMRCKGSVPLSTKPPKDEHDIQALQQRIDELERDKADYDDRLAYVRAWFGGTARENASVQQALSVMPQKAREWFAPQFDGHCHSQSSRHDSVGELSVQGASQEKYDASSLTQRPKRPKRSHAS